MTATEGLMSRRLSRLGDFRDVACSTGNPPTASAITTIAHDLGLPRRRVVEFLFEEAGMGGYIHAGPP
jgi:hypothetical protein